MTDAPKGFHEATFYVQLTPTFGQKYNNTTREYEVAVTVVRATGITQKMSRARNGTLQTKLTVQIPDGAFLPLRPEAIVVIPESMTVTNPIEVEASDPNDDDSDLGYAD